ETAAPEPPAPAAEEEESIVVEDAYIDTPLCTSCNDCISLNSQMFAYDANKQAFVKDASKGTFRQLVEAAEKCPVHIIHPGKPVNPDEPGLEDLIKKAEAYN
ncbi:MAG TPA: ferredoxin, partial [Calditrichia bacterium]|nr:ferredoxin [Calditrichia bacterium]